MLFYSSMLLYAVLLHAVSFDSTQFYAVLLYYALFYSTALYSHIQLYTALFYVITLLSTVLFCSTHYTLLYSVLYLLSSTENSRPPLAAPAESATRQGSCLRGHRRRKGRKPPSLKPVWDECWRVQPKGTMRVMWSFVLWLAFDWSEESSCCVTRHELLHNKTLPAASNSSRGHLRFRIRFTGCCACACISTHVSCDRMRHAYIISTALHNDHHGASYRSYNIGKALLHSRSTDHVGAPF